MRAPKIDVIMERGSYFAVWNDNGNPHRRNLKTSNVDEALDRLNRLIEILATEDEPFIPRRQNYVYFIKCLDFVKIGIAFDPKDRLSQLQSGSPLPLTMVSYIKAGAALERVLHKRFSQYRHNREWFKLDGRLKEFISTISLKNKDSPCVQLHTPTSALRELHLRIPLHGNAKHPYISTEPLPW